MFGSVSFWLFFENDYEAMRSLDNYRDRILAGDELDGVAIQHDRNSNGVSDPGEVQSLAQWKITTLSCDYEEGDYADRTAYS